ncbi:MAG: hypothetical protein QM680_01335 [Luteolibacter sp.]
MVRALPAFPDAENRRVVFIENIGAGGDAGVRTGGGLELSDGKHEGHAGVRLGGGEGVFLARLAEADRGQGKKAQRDDREQHHEGERDDESESSVTAEGFTPAKWSFHGKSWVWGFSNGKIAG